MKRFWITLICVVCLVATIGLVSAYWIGDFLFRNMLQMNNSETFIPAEDSDLLLETEKGTESLTSELPTDNKQEDTPMAPASDIASPEDSKPIPAPSEMQQNLPSIDPAPVTPTTPGISELPTVTESPTVTQPNLPSTDPVPVTPATPPVTESPAVTEPELTDAEIIASVESVDKMAIALWILPKLSSSDLSTLFNMVSDGVLSAEEKVTAKAICYSRFSGDDLLKVKAYYDKYKGNLTIIP